jgi:endonuclease/exonuclease/phosphatase family metal-dependent hydrolase
MSELKVICANLLAEKPYSKYTLNTGGRELYLTPEVRKNLFIKTFETHEADIYLLQEVDENWKSVLQDILIPKGYSFLVAASWSSSMATAFRNERFKDPVIEFIHPEAGIQTVSLLEDKRQIKLVNIHARWGNAEAFIKEYHKVFHYDGPLLAGGDFNLDKPTDKPNDNRNKEFFAELMTMCGLTELTSALDATAKHVKDASRFEKLDLIIGKDVSLKNIALIPKELNCLLPHTQDPMFDPTHPGNHFSDHAMVLCEVEY